MAKKKDPVLHVRISKATKVVWEGDAKSVSSENSDGKFDILAMHSNFITLINKVPIAVMQVDGEKKEYQFDQSVILVTDNNVRIYADIS